MGDDIARRLVEALVENPDDLATRAVLADRLLELDDVRGRMIQLDLELRKAGDGGDADRHLQNQIDSLVIAHGRQLAGDLADLVERYDLAGGFVDHITTTVAVFKAHGDRWFREQPVRSFAPKPFNAAAIKALAKCPHLGLVRTLRLERSGPDKIGSVPLAWLTRANLDRLECLELTWATLSGNDAEVFFRELRAPRLRTIRFRSGFLDGHALRGLAANQVLCSQLEHLQLTQVSERYGLLERGEHAIADEAFAVAAFPHLKELHVDYCWFARPGRIATLLARAPMLEELQTDQVDDFLLEAAAACKQLKRLFGIYAPLSTEAIAHLLALPALEALLVVPTDWREAEIDALVDALVALPATHPLRRVTMRPAPSRLAQRFP